MTNSKLTCVWNIGISCSGNVEIRELFARKDGNTLELPICEACSAGHNRILEIAKENNCGADKALEIFEKELEAKEQ